MGLDDKIENAGEKLGGNAQEAAGETYFDAAGAPGRTLGLRALGDAEGRAAQP